ncbi:MAG: TolC family protein [Candidatus Binataceae bacterium]
MLFIAVAEGADSGPITPGSQLTLKQAIQIALEFHPRRQQAMSESGAARERVGEARSYMLPQAYGLSDYLRSTTNGIGNTQYYADGLFPRISGVNHNLPNGDFSQSSDTSNNYLGGVSISQFLFDFGRHRGLVNQRRFEAAATEAQEQMVDLDLVFEVSQSYFNLLAAQQMVRVYEKAVEQRQVHLHAAEVRTKAALRPELDVFVTRAELERAQLNLVQARNATADAKVQLDNSMGLSDQAPSYSPADVLTSGKVADNMKDLVAQGLRLRPDLIALKNEAHAMGAEITEYRSDYFPQANAMGGYNAMGTGLPAVNNFNVGLVITWPIFNGFLTTHQVEEARLNQQAIEHAIKDLQQRVILQIKTAFLNWQSSVQEIQRARGALEASQVELELADKRYNAGLTNIVELEDAQRHYTFDDAEFANALYNYSLTKAAVDHATGRLLSYVQGIHSVAGN